MSILNDNSFTNKKYLFYPQYSNDRYNENEAINVVWNWIFSACNYNNNNDYIYEIRALRHMNNTFFHKAAQLLQKIVSMKKTSNQMHALNH
jgi:xanthine dehydrogenase molybdopterin-binding subunit B